ncbi:MAG: hypothetical protein AB8I08_14425 [Sandaracinaceae bacterium]
MTEAAAENEIAAALDLFRASLDKRWALARDRARSEEVSREARPVAIALLALGDREEPGRFELREALALTSLLGRRVGTLEITPTATLSVLPALLASLELDADLREQLEPVFIEGFVAGREERLSEEHAARLGDAIVYVALLPRLWSAFIGGAQEASVIEAALEGIGRKLLEHDAAALLVHVARLEAPSPETAAQVFTLDATCRMLGVRCIFAGVSDDLQRAAEERGLDLSLVEIEADPADAFQLALEACALSVRQGRGFGEALRRFVGR